MPQLLARRDLYFLLIGILGIVQFREPLRDLIYLAWHNERYSHIVLMPFISIGLLYLDRKKILSHVRYCRGLGISLLGLIIVFYLTSTRWFPSLSNTDKLAIIAFITIALWLAGFILCYGTTAFQRAIFPLSLLLLSIPIPPTLMNLAELALQKGSAEATYGIFKLTGIPVFREGVKFSLPGVVIEIGQECSGIRSSIALLIVALVLSHLFLRSIWLKICLVVLTIPIAIFKNAVRIAAISGLGVYVSPDFLIGDLHRRGGLPFSLLALALLVPLLLVLQRWEAGSVRRVEVSARAPLHTRSGAPTPEPAD